MLLIPSGLEIARVAMGVSSNIQVAYESSESRRTHAVFEPLTLCVFLLQNLIIQTISGVTQRNCGTLHHHDKQTNKQNKSSFARI